MRCWRSKDKQQNSSPDKTYLDLLDRPVVPKGLLRGFNVFLSLKVNYLHSKLYFYMKNNINLLLQMFGSNLDHPRVISIHLIFVFKVLLTIHQ